MCALTVFIICAVQPVKASAETNPKAADNSSVWLIKNSFLEAMDDGGYMRVFYADHKVYVEYYSPSFKLMSRDTIEMELPMWGGFFKGSDAYYLCEGQENTDEKDNAEVIRVIKYDFGWNRLGAASITGNKDQIWGSHVRYPFDYGCVEMTEYNGKLFITTGHEGYVDPNYNQGHQGYLLMMVDTDSMTGKIIDADLWHSFAQYIKNDGTGLYIYQQSEGSRCTTLDRFDLETLIKCVENGKISYFYNSEISDTEQVFKYGGVQTSAWAIPCYATVNDMALSADNVLGIGTSIDQSKYESYDSNSTPYNIYLTVTPKNEVGKGKTSVKWLTSYSSGAKQFTGVFLTKISDDRFLVTWGEKNTSKTPADVNDPLSGNVLHYLFIDGSGNKLSSEYTARASISDCRPTVSGGKAVFYTSNGSSLDFYGIDVNSGASSKKVYRIAGDSATWECKDGVLTISGTGSLYACDTENVYWSGTLFSPLADVVTKVVVKSGISDIPAYEFAYLTELKTVVIEPGVKTIGKRAFSNIHDLERVYIPKSVTSIGEDIVWTGWYWTGSGDHVYSAAICTNYGSAAYKYAEKYSIKYLLDLADAEISGISSSYSATGSAIVPNITVKLGGKTLTKGTDYTVTCKNNVNAGTATLTITGTENYKGYFGTRSANFNIRNPQKSISKCTVTLSGTSFEYTGSPIKPAVTVKDGTKTLKENTDYSVSYVNNVNAGTAYVYIGGKGDYNDVVSKSFTITPPTNIAKAEITHPKSVYWYEGKAVEPEPTVKLGGKTLTKGTDYTVTYRNNSTTGKAYFAVKGIGNYTGRQVVYYKIAPGVQTITDLRSFTAQKIVITWKKDKRATGYQFQISADPTFKTGVTTHVAQTSDTISRQCIKLKSGTTYYFRLRAYKMIDGARCYGPYTDVQSCTAK